MADADSHQLWRVGGDHEGQAQRRRLWNVIDKGTDNEEDDMSAMEAILAAMPTEYRDLLGAKKTTKESWEAIAIMRVGSDRAKKAMA